MLGLLPDDQATALEEEYFVNRAVFLRIQSEERVLIADYLEGRLGSEEKQSFESRYLKAPELQRKVDEARRQRNVSRPAVKAWVRLTRPLAAGAAFAMVLCLAIGMWAFYHWQKPAQRVAQVQPAEPNGGTQSEQASNGNTSGQGSLLPESNPVISNGATLEFHMGQPLFIASGKSYLVGDRGPCAISNGDVLLRTVSIPYENNTAFVSVVRSKPGDCKVDTYLQVKVGYLEEMHKQFQERSDADMRRMQALANQASPQNAAVAVNVPPPGSASTASVASENNKAVESPSHSGQAAAANRTANNLPQIADAPKSIAESREQTQGRPHSTLESSALPVDSTIYGNRNGASESRTGLNSASGSQSMVLEMLQAQYTMARGTNGCHIGNPETALTTQSRGGGMRVLPVTSSNMIIAKCTNSFADGKLKPANSACNGSGVGKSSGFLSHIPKVGGALGAGSKVGDQAANQEMDVVATGDKIYPTNLDVNESKGEVKVTFMTCKQSGDQQNPYKGELVFKFNSLKPTDVSKVEDTIGQVFRQGGDDSGSQGNNDGGYQSSDNGGSNGSARRDNQSPVCNPEVGQTIKQVTDACGQPVNQTKGATKTQFFYNQPKIKVIFVNGKVTDIE
ncbi:MAG TPA: hypothetical protein VHA06_02060 [Candidatus Angelobacter sp.]|nr:hypothetical protein [Candidatus Angelobacter sp.]